MTPTPMPLCRSVQLVLGIHHIKRVARYVSWYIDVVADLLKFLLNFYDFVTICLSRCWSSVTSNGCNGCNRTTNLAFIIVNNEVLVKME